MTSAARVEETIIDTQTLTRLVVSSLLDKKGRDILVLDVKGRTSYCDRLVLCTAGSARQVRALATHVLQTFRVEAGRTPLGSEGLENGRWALVDLGEIVVHIFDETSRSHYDLDGLWVDATRVSLADLGLPQEAEHTAEAAPFL